MPLISSSESSSGIQFLVREFFCKVNVSVKVRKMTVSLDLLKVSKQPSQLSRKFSVYDIKMSSHSLEMLPRPPSPLHY